MSAIATHKSADAMARGGPDGIALVRNKVDGVRFGVVQLTAHFARITQIERTEKTRLPATREGL